VGDRVDLPHGVEHGTVVWDNERARDWLLMMSGALGLACAEVLGASSR
jgi:hypothetical protein